MAAWRTDKAHKADKAGRRAENSVATTPGDRSSVAAPQGHAKAKPSTGEGKPATAGSHGGIGYRDSDTPGIAAGFGAAPTAHPPAAAYDGAPTMAPVAAPRPAASWLARPRKYLLAASTAIQNQLQYPLELLGPVLTYSLFVFVNSQIWKTAMGPTGRIAGYSAAEATGYFVVAEACFMSLRGVFGQISRDIRTGQIAYSLGRPYGYLPFLGAQKTATGLLQGLVLLAIGTTITVAQFGLIPALPAWRWAALALGFVLGIAIQYSLVALLSLTAFWFEDNTAIAFLYGKVVLIGGVLMPMDFLPEAGQRILLATPTPWFTWAPARLLVSPASTEPGTILGLLAAQGLWLAGLSVIISLAFRLARPRLSVMGG